MVRYIIKRILMLIPVLIGVSFLIFTIMEVTPGDPVREMLGDYATQEQIDAMREDMGLNGPFLVRYFRYVFNAARGDFGKSYQTRQPVVEQILVRFPTTMRLAFGAIFIVLLVGIPIGILSAVKQYSLMDNVSMLISMLMASMPNFWLGLMLMILFSLQFHLLPATGASSLKHFIMPWMTLSAVGSATMIRMTRSTMLEVIRQDYIRTARAKGAGEQRAIFRHALRNALLPVITVAGTQLSISLGGSIVIENVFALPGIGTMILNGIKMKDAPVVLAGVLFIAVIGGLVNLCVDILYAFIDPRLKAQFVKPKRRVKGSENIGESKA